MYFNAQLSFVCVRNARRSIHDSTRDTQERYHSIFSYLAGVPHLLAMRHTMELLYRHDITLLSLHCPFENLISLRILSLFSGNMWGTCENGTEAVGCGRPETFRNCADVRILTSTGAIPPRILFQNTIYQLYSVAPKFSTTPLARPLR